MRTRWCLSACGYTNICVWHFFLAATRAVQCKNQTNMWQYYMPASSLNAGNCGLVLLFERLQVLKLHSIVSPLRPECFAFLNDFVYSMNPFILVFNACAHFESPGFYSFTPHASDLRKNCQFVDCYIRLHASKWNGYILGCLCQRFKISWNASNFCTKSETLSTVALAVPGPGPLHCTHDGDCWCPCLYCRLG